MPIFDADRINEGAFDYFPPLRRVKEYVDENYAGEVSLETVARIAGLERKYFSTFFHSKVGVSFRYWLMWVRIQEAIRLMRIEHRSITEIALAVGFGDLRTFERAFKTWVNSTPRAFKKSLLPGIELSVAKSGIRGAKFTKAA